MASGFGSVQSLDGKTPSEVAPVGSDDIIVERHTAQGFTDCELYFKPAWPIHRVPSVTGNNEMMPHVIT